MDEQQRKIIASLLSNYPKDSTTIDLLHSADFTDKEDIPSGIITKHQAELPIHVDSIANNTFDYLIVCPILNSEKLNDEYFKTQQDKIKEAVPQFVSNPCSLDTKDTNAWSAELGENEASFGGIFKVTKGRDTNYYICCQAGAPIVCQEMRQKISNSPNMTFQNLLEDPEFSNAHHLSLRNAEKLAYNIARSFKVPIKHCADISAYTATEFSGKPMRAIPKYIQPISSICKLKDTENKAVGVFNKVTPIMNNNNMYHFVYAGPYNGIGMYYMNQKSIGNGLPTHTGRYENPQSISAGDLNKRCNGVLCEKMNAKNHPDIKQESYKHYDDESFAEGMKTLGWNTKYPVLHMVPVVVKIWDPSTKRN